MHEPVDHESGMAPLVSVVMGVRNGASCLAATLDSLASQEEVNLEIVVINDGSSDDTGEILAAYAARDPRLRVLERRGRGLTRSLIEGCQVARGPFIARQDAGDLSLPGRLRRQLRCLEEHPDASLCSTHVRLVVPEGATARVNTPEPRDLADGLTGPAIHGSVMMRRSAYERAGGYRSMFYFAQDIDLWSRMVEIGTPPGRSGGALRGHPLARIDQRITASGAGRIPCAHRRDHPGPTQRPGGDPLADPGRGPERSLPQRRSGTTPAGRWGLLHRRLPDPRASRPGPSLPAPGPRSQPLASQGPTQAGHPAMTLSVAIPTYGRDQVLIDSVAALLALDPPPFELLVVDQTPRHDPAIEERLAAWQEEGRIRWLRLPTPSITGAMNRALQEACGEQGAVPR